MTPMTAKEKIKLDWIEIAKLKEKLKNSIPLSKHNEKIKEMEKLAWEQYDKLEKVYQDKISKHNKEIALVRNHWLKIINEKDNERQRMVKLLFEAGITKW